MGKCLDTGCLCTDLPFSRYCRGSLPNYLPCKSPTNTDVQMPPTGVYPSFPSAIPAGYGAVGTPYPESLVTYTHNGYSPVAHPSETESLRQAMSSWPPQVDTSNWQQEAVSMNATSTLEHGHRYTYIRTPSEFPAPSTVPTPTARQYQEHRAPRDMPQRPQKSGDSSTASQRSPLRPDERRGTPDGRHSCSICGRAYVQPQGVTRHHRDVYEVSPCMHCTDFGWHRRHQLKKHIEKQHPDVDLPASLGEVTRSRRRATIMENYLRQQRTFLATEHVRIESRPRQSIQPPHAVAGRSSRTQPASGFQSFEVSNTIPF
jgi:hypothetical protein